MKESEEIPIAIPIIIFSVSCLFAGGIVAKYHYDLNPNFRSWVDERFLGAPNIMEIRAKEAIVEREAAVNRDSWAHRPAAVKSFPQPQPQPQQPSTNTRAQSLASRFIPYPLEGIWQGIMILKKDGATQKGPFTLVVKGESGDKGTIRTTYNYGSITVVAKKGNNFLIQTEIVLGNVELKGEIVAQNKMSGSWSGIGPLSSPHGGTFSATRRQL